MEKIVTKIGDVTIERRVSKTSLQKFASDRSNLPQNPAKNALDEIVKSFPQSELLRQENVYSEKQTGNASSRGIINTNLNTNLSNSMDMQLDMEQKMALHKRNFWDLNIQPKLGSWNQSDFKTGLKNLTRYDNGSEKRIEPPVIGHPDMSRYSGISIERKRPKLPESEVCEGRPDHNDRFFLGSNFIDREASKANIDVQSFKPGFPTNFSAPPKIPPSYNFPGSERLTYPGLTVEKKSNREENFRQYPNNSLGNAYVPAQRFHSNSFSSKSPIHLSSDEEKPVEDIDSDLKDLEGRFRNDSEDYEEEDDINLPMRCFGSESAIDRGKMESSSKQSIVLGKKSENLCRPGSPILLSSEDDDRNDDIVEVVDRSRFRDATTSLSQPDNLTTEKKYSEPLVLDSSFSGSSDKKKESKKSSNPSMIKLPLGRDPFEYSESSDEPIVRRKSSYESEVISDEGTTPSNESKQKEQQDCKDSEEVKNSSLSDIKDVDTYSENARVGTGEDKRELDQSEVETKKADKDCVDSEDLEKKDKAEQEDGESALKSSETELPPSDESVEGDEKESKIGDVKEEMGDIVCDDLMELMKKGEIEGEVEDEDDKEFESEEDGTNKKSGVKRKAEEGEAEKDESKAKGKKKKSEKGEGEDAKEEDDKNIDKTKVTSANLRKNIREVMDETKLDEATISAQRQEAERLKRLQDQQKIIRELQKQIVLNRQNQKSHNRVLSLLQGNSQTSILKTNSSVAPQTPAQSKSPNHVLVKLSNGQQTSLNNKKMIELLKNSKNKVTLSKPSIPKTLLKQGMVSPSVSIAPIVKKEVPVDDKKKKKGDIVTLSSDSEDDCIVLSEEDESEPEEDPTNSGMHTSDKYNVPDEQGRVIVNVGHPESESDIFLAPQIARIIKPHQIGGIRFLYDNVIESIERFQSSTGFGCILAHSMGLGKTLQIVSFSDIFLRYTSAKTILCIMPINTIQNWLAEFNMWLPKENNSSQEIRCRDFDLYIVNESLKNLNARSKVILDWQRSGGVLLMGYELFRLLSLKKSYKSKKKKREIEEKEDEAKNKELIEEVYAALVRPGPDLVICDEGHRIKNSHATTSQALKQIRTKRRIVLTGYPLQNNLLEYWCMVDFVRPNYLGSKTEFSNMFERPIQNGQCIDSTPQDKRLMRYRAHVLHSLLEGFVQRRSHAVLQSTLPEKEEYVLLLRFTPFQRKLYDTFMNEVVRTVAVPNPLKAFAVCCKIWNHPDVLYNFLKKKGEEIDLDLEEALPPSLQPSGYPFGQTPPDGMSQFPPSPMIQAWPRRGPGSRGGKVRQCIGNRRPGRGRKPAATVSPNILPGCEKKEQDSEGFNSSNYPPNYHDFQQQKSSEPLPEGDMANRNFSARGFNQYSSSEFGNPPNFTGSGYDSKNPLENLEDLSSGDFQNKVFYSQQNEGNIQTNFSAATCMQQQNMNYSQNMTQSNNSDVKSSFNCNMSRSDSRFNQTDTSKPFSYNQDYNSEFYTGANYQTQHSNADFEQNNKTGFNRNNPSSDSSSFYHNSRFADGRENNMGYNIQPSNSSLDSNYQGYANRNPDQNFQQGNLNKHFQNQTLPVSNTGYNDSNNPGLNYQNAIIDSQRKSCSSDIQNMANFSQPTSRPSDSNYQRNDFQSSGSNFSNNTTNFDHTNSDRDMNSGSNFQGSSANFNRSGYSQDYWSSGNWNACGFDSNKSGSERNNEFMQGEKYNMYDSGSDKSNVNKFASDDMEKKMNSGFGVRVKNEVELDCNYGKMEDDKNGNKMKEEGVQSKIEEEVKPEKKEDFKSPEICMKKEDQLSYDWATDLFKNYITGIIENSSKMEVFFHILTESIKLGDRLLVFSQSLLTLDLIEDYLHRRNVPDREEKWAKNRNYFRLDGSTPGLEREKLINEFNSNSNIFIFLVSTRAGSLGINLVGANRVVVFDASWNPCHDTQAVCRVYRYGQQKPCFVYRLVMDSCLEKKIYDRQINKQGMADRVVDELNPDAHLSIKEVTNLCWDDQEDTTVKDFSYLKDKYNDQIIKILLGNCSKLLSKEPFQHESLLIDRKEKKLSQAEKRLAKRSYELEKQAANQPKNIYSFFPNTGGPRSFGKPIASVRPMPNEMASRVPPIPSRSKWIPAEVWQKQGMSAQEMTLPLDVVIPTNAPDKTSIVLKAGQRVMVLKSPKGIYMQLENGKIIAIRTAFKVGQGSHGSQSKTDELKKDIPLPVSSALKNNPNVTITPKSSSNKMLSTKPPFIRAPDKKPVVNITAARPKQPLGKTKPLLLNRKFQSVTPEIRQRLLAGKSGFESQDEKLSLRGAEDDDVILTKDVKESSKYENMAPEQGDVVPSNQKRKDEPPEQLVSKGELNSSLETLRKVTENIKDDAKLENSSDNSQVQMNLKNYRHNFSSQLKGKSQESDDEKEVKNVNEIDSGNVKHAEEPSGSFNGNENVQNWLMNQSYANVDPYNNYFSNYYGYGQSAGSMINPYEGFYQNNYGHSLNRSGNVPAKQDSQAEGTKSVPYQQNQPNPKMQSISNSSNARSSSSSMYPSYPNPYHQYSYNYPSNPSYNNQSYPFTGQSQGNQPQQQLQPQQHQHHQQQATATTTSMNSGNSAATNSTQSQSYDNSMYSAFHRPEGHYQSSENPYPTSYRPPYPNSTTPGFFPYNAPYRPYSDPNYHYNPNFNPYVHHAGYGYPVQNPSQINNSAAFNQHSTQSATNSS